MYIFHADVNHINQQSLYCGLHDSKSQHTVSYVLTSFILMLIA
jgi:hypothetical protein